MLFKSFSRHHASLAKTLFAASNSSHHSHHSHHHHNGSSSFFITTAQLKRQQSQLAPRTSIRSDGKSGKGYRPGTDTNPNAYACLGGGASAYSTLSPLTTLDDDKRREAAASIAIVRHNRQRRSSTGGIFYTEPFLLASDSSSASSSTLALQQKHPQSSSALVLAPGIRQLTLAPPSSRRRRYSTSVCSSIISVPVATPSFPPSRHSHSNRSNHLPLARRPHHGAVGSSNVHITHHSQRPHHRHIEYPKHASSYSSSSATKISPLDPAETRSKQPSPDIHLSSVLSHAKLDRHAKNSSTSSATTLVSPTTETATSLPPSPPIDTISSSHPSHLFTDVETAILADSYDTLLGVFQKHTSDPNLVPDTPAVEYLLSYLATKPPSSSNAVAALEVYSLALTRGTAPSTPIYSSILSILLDTADVLSAQESSFLYTRISTRHASPQRRRNSPPTLLPSVNATLEQFKSAAKFAKLALDIFAAANTVTNQSYSRELYDHLLSSCVRYHLEDHLYSVIRSFESKDYALTPQSYELLIKGYGNYGDATAVIECYRFYKYNAFRFQDKREMHVYAALITALMQTDCVAPALTFFKQLLDSRSSFSSRSEASAFIKSLGPVLSAIVRGFANLGDLKSCWTWIQKVEADLQFPAVDIPALVEVMSKACDTNKIKFAEKLFDYMASRKDSATTPEFNTSRCDLLALAVRANTPNLLMKLIKESQVRGGVWDISTLMTVSKYLILIGDTELALKVFNQQSFRLSQQPDFQDAQATEAFAGILNSLLKHNVLNVKNALELSRSVFFGPRSFFDNKGGQTILKTLWDNPLDTIRADFPLIDSYIISLHLVWIEACSTDNSLGGLSIPYPLFDDLKENFAKFVRALIDQQKEFPVLGSDFTGDVSKALGLLGDNDTKWLWQQFCETITSPKPSTAETATATTASLPFDVERTSAIALAAQSSTTLIKALDDLEAAASEHILIGPEAYIALIENAALARSTAIIQTVYTCALTALPHPSEHVDAWAAWNMLHRAIVTRAASLDSDLARAAYAHLLEMGSFPCVSGYAQLIVRAPKTAECSDELALFAEAAGRHGLALNTDIYNALMAKLARVPSPANLARVKELYKDMDATGVRKDASSYEIVVRACCRAADLVSAESCLDDMMASPYLQGPTIAPFNDMLSHYVYTARDRAAAMKVYERLLATSLTPSELTYRLVIDAHTMIAPVDLDAADRVLLSIVGAKRTVSTKHYASLIFGRGVGLRDASAAEEFYNALVSHNRVRPDKHIFHALLEALVVSGAVSRTTHVLREMVKYGVDLDDSYAANLLIRGWAPVNIIKAVGLFEHALATEIADESTFESLFRAHLFHGDFSAASSVLDALSMAVRQPTRELDELSALLANCSATPLTHDQRMQMLFEGIYPNSAPRIADAVAMATAGPQRGRVITPSSSSSQSSLFEPSSISPSLVDY